MSIRVGDALACLRAMPAASVHCCVTSPPYWGLRDYGTPPQIWGGDPACRHRWGDEGKSGQRLRNGIGSDAGVGTRKAETLNPPTGAFCARCGAWRGSLGLEPTPALYVRHLVEVFREARRVLRKDGTLWLNIGDSYAGRWASRRDTGRRGFVEASRERTKWTDRSLAAEGLKDKDLIGIPWRVAFALQDDGWWLRRDHIWAKPNPMPESVRDRCTTAHEYLFLLTKSARYYYDGAAIKEPAADCRGGLRFTEARARAMGRAPSGNERHDHEQAHSTVRNKRSVWTVATAPFPGAHFATFPPALIEPCILAGCPAGGTVLDPFLGAGTTALVADRLGRHCIGLEAQPGLCGDGARPDRRPQIGARGGVSGAALPPIALHRAAARGGARHGADLGALRLRRARLRARLVVRRLQRLRLPDNAARLRRRAGRRRRAQRRL